MRQFIIAAVVAIGLVAFWATVLSLTAQEVTKQVVAMPGPMSKALFMCHGQDGLNQACVTALAKALVLDAKAGERTQVSARRCRSDQQVLANLNRHD